MLSLSAYVPNRVLVHLVGQKAIEVRKCPEPPFTPLGQFQPWTRQEQPCLRTSSLLVRPHAFYPAPLPLKHFLALLARVFPRWEAEGWLRLSGHREGHSWQKRVQTGKAACSRSKSVTWQFCLQMLLQLRSDLTWLGCKALYCAQLCPQLWRKGLNQRAQWRKHCWRWCVTKTPVTKEVAKS